MGSINGRDILLALPDKEKWTHVFMKLEEHEEKHQDHARNFNVCDDRFKTTIEAINKVSEAQSKAIKAHAAASERRHQELMAQHGELLDKLSLVISITENSKKGAGLIVWFGGVVKKIASTIKEFIFVFVIIGLLWNIYTKNLTTEQLSQIAAKFMGGK